MADQRSLWDQPDEQAPAAPALDQPARATPRILRVTDLNRRVRSLLDADAILADVWVEGEVSQPSFPASGHCFFTLKDANSQVRAA
ncbi:MAG: exodeoxyribonuclease VII large subunit, partial [Candidatus Limnocylindria bacterium]